MNTEVIGNFLKWVKSKICTKINMVNSRLLYSFGISSEIDSQMGDQLNPKN